MRQVEFLDSEIEAVEQLIAAEALSWPEVKRLMTVPRGESLADEGAGVAMKASCSSERSQSRAGAGTGAALCEISLYSRLELIRPKASRTREDRTPRRNYPRLPLSQLRLSR